GERSAELWSCITLQVAQRWREKILKSTRSSIPVAWKNRSTDSAPPQYSTVTHTMELPREKLQLAFPSTTSQRQHCAKSERPTELSNCRASVRRNRQIKKLLQQRAKP